jgi:hypothetical protein
MRLTRFRFRAIGSHTALAPPLPPAADRCTATAVSTGRRCKLPAGPNGFCGVFHRSVPSNGPRAA